MNIDMDIDGYGGQRDKGHGRAAVEMGGGGVTLL